MRHGIHQKNDYLINVLSRYVIFFRKFQHINTTSFKSPNVLNTQIYRIFLLGNLSLSNKGENPSMWYIVEHSLVDGKVIGPNVTQPGVNLCYVRDIVVVGKKVLAQIRRTS